MKTRFGTTPDDSVAAAQHTDEVMEFYRRVMILVRQQPQLVSTVSAGLTYSRQFSVAGLYITEVIRIPEFGHFLFSEPRDFDNYQLQVEEGDGVRFSLIFSKQRFPRDPGPEYCTQNDRVSHYLPVLRKLTVLDELSSV